MAERERLIAATHAEWAAEGRLHDPPDDSSEDNDLAFWQAVEPVTGGEAQAEEA